MIFQGNLRNGQGNLTEKCNPFPKADVALIESGVLSAGTTEISFGATCTYCMIHNIDGADDIDILFPEHPDGGDRLTADSVGEYYIQTSGVQLSVSASDIAYSIIVLY